MSAEPLSFPEPSEPRELPPKVAIYPRVKKAATSLEDDVYARAVTSLKTSGSLKPKFTDVLPTQALKVRKYHGLDFDDGSGGGPKIDLEGHPVNITAIKSTIGEGPSPDDLLDAIQFDLDGHDGSQKKVFLYPEIPPTLVDNGKFLEVLNKNKDYTGAGILKALKELPDTDKRELTDGECEGISSVLENYKAPDEIVDLAHEEIYQSFFPDQ